MSFCGLDSQRSFKAETQSRCHVNPFEICGGQKAFWQFVLRVLGFYPVSIIRPILHTHFNLHVAPTGSTNRRSWETFRISENIEHRSTCTILFFKGLFSITAWRITLPPMCNTLHKRVTLNSGVALSAHYAKHSWLRRIL